MSEPRDEKKVTFSVCIPKQIADAIAEIARDHRPAVSRSALIAYILESYVADHRASV